MAVRLVLYLTGWKFGLLCFLVRPWVITVNPA